MPKMNADYFSKKRNKILDAAFAVCMKKPMHEVSMRDVISESGLSQGGIYRYYSNLDEILVELINRDSIRHGTKEKVDMVVSLDYPPEKVVEEVFLIWEKTILDSLIGIGKIYYEICVIYANDKERLDYFTSNNLMSSEQNYLWEKLFNFIGQQISEGYFIPKIPLDDLLKLHIITIDGIMRDLILCGHYGLPLPFPGMLDKERIVKSFCLAFVIMLGGNDELLYKENPL